MGKRLLIGYAPIDSGNIIVIDAGYVSRGFDYDDLLAQRFPEDEGGKPHKSGCFEFKWESANPDYLGVPQRPSFYQGVVSTCGYGDGEYPVYAILDEHGCVEKLEVIFIENELDSDSAEGETEEGEQP